MSSAINKLFSFKSLLRLFSALTIVAITMSLIKPASEVQAASILSVTPLTWNMIGLDSNDVTSGPNQFPVGARVCNALGATTATNVVVTFHWDSTNSYINLASGTSSSLTFDSIPANTCKDAYFTVEVTRTASAYNTTRKYYITAVDTQGITTRTPNYRELFVEHLVSQNRNSVTGIEINGTPLAVGASTLLVVGQTYSITLYGATSTNGYNQLESFLNLPNTIFQVISVATSYSAATGGFTSPTDKLYADACNWVNDTNSLYYQSCTTDGKAGGTVITTYSVKILAASGGPTTIRSLFYDFSGSSFHYNSDFSFTDRTVYAVDPSTINISKSFSPSSIVVGGSSTLTFTIPNTTSTTITGVSFTDSFPTGMTVAGTPGASTSGCGSATFSPTAGSSSISFSGGTIAANSTCNVRVNVTASSAGTYNNTSSTLKYVNYGNTIDTGETASSSLIVSTAETPTATPSTCATPATLVQWTFPTANGTTLPPAYDSGSKASDVSTATAAFTNGGGNLIHTSALTPNSTSGVNYWNGYGWLKSNQTFSTTASPYYLFSVDTHNYYNVKMQFKIERDGNGPTTLYTYYDSGSGITLVNPTYSSTAGNAPITTAGVWYTVNLDLTGLASSTGTTNFYIYGYNAQTNTSGSDTYLDDIYFTGCQKAPLPPNPPTLTKAFGTSSLAINSTTTLTFTITNPNSSTALSGIQFSDPLPDGLVVASTPAASTTCTGATFSPTAGSMTLDFSGGSLSGGGSCTASVTVKITKAGSITNTSGYISASASGTNSTSSGYATASITGTMLPPSIAKSFLPTSIITGGISTITFTITNPNPNDSLTGVSFTDNLPANLVNADQTTYPATNSCGGTLTAATGGNLISLSGVSIVGGGSCTITVKATAASSGSYPNSVTVSSTNGGTGNTASATLSATAPSPKLSLLKQVSLSASGPWSSNIEAPASTGIYYRFIVENIGDISLSNIGITDANVNTSGCSFTNPLTAGDFTTCIVGPITSASTSGEYSNTAYAQGSYNPGTGTVTVDSNTSTANYYIYPDLTATVTDNVYGNVYEGNTFNWTSTVSNTGTVSALFTDGMTIFSQTLPIANYGSLTMGSNTNIIGAANISCAIEGSALVCKASGGSVEISADGNFSVILPVTPVSRNTLTSTITVDPDSAITESNESNNVAEDTVTVLTDPSITPTVTFTVTATASNTATATSTDTSTPAPTATNSITPTPTETKTLTPTSTHTMTFTPSMTPTPSQTDTLTPTVTNTLTPTATETETPSPTPSITLTPTFTETATPTVTDTLTPTATDTPTPSPSVTLTPTQTETHTPTVTETLTTTPSPSPSPTASVTVTPSPTAIILGSPSLSVSKSASPLSYSSEGQNILYDFLIRNTGDVLLTNIKVNDSLASVSCPATSLGVGEYMNCTASYSISSADMTAGSVQNSVEVTSSEVPSPQTDTMTIQKVDASLVGTIQGVIYRDANLDASYETGESLITQTVMVQLVDSSGNILSTVFSVNGNYSFTGIPAGNYHVVKWTAPDGYLPTSENDVEVSLSAGGTTEVDFGHYKLASGSSSVSGYAWDDANQDLIWNDGEDPISTITITLYNANSEVVSTKQTDANGYYSFAGLSSGLYTIVETDGSAYPNSSTVNSRSVIVGAKSPSPVNFGDYEAVTACGSYSDPAVNLVSGGYPTSAKAGDAYFIQFQVTNNGNAVSDTVDVSSQIPSFADVLSVNVFFSTSTTSPHEKDPYTVTLSGNSLIVHFSYISPGNVYDIFVSGLVNETVEGGTSKAQVFLNTSSAACADLLSTNNSSSLSVKTSTGGVAVEAASKAPETGFIPGHITILPLQPESLKYEVYQGVSLEIPALSLDIPIEGIPLVDGSWDATWLGNSAGWLNGSAYPGSEGNSVIVGHVYLANGLPGPFVALDNLKWGDQIIVKEGSQALTYRVSSVSITGPNDPEIMQHETEPVLTLVTCKGYDESSRHYLQRVVVKAQLLEVTSADNQ